MWAHENAEKVVFCTRVNTILYFLIYSRKSLTTKQSLEIEISKLQLHVVPKHFSCLIVWLIQISISSIFLSQNSCKSNRIVARGSKLLNLSQVPFTLTLCQGFEDALSIQSQTFLSCRGGYGLSHISTTCNLQTTCQIVFIFLTHWNSFEACVIYVTRVYVYVTLWLQGWFD